MMKRIEEGSRSLNKKLDDCHNSLMESIYRTIEDNRKFREKLRKEREQSMEQSSQKVEGNRSIGEELGQIIDDGYKRLEERIRRCCERTKGSF